MKITWHGHSCFRLTERGMATVVTDPYNHKKIGYDELNLSADIVTVSHDAPGHNHTKVIKKGRMVNISSLDQVNMKSVKCLSLVFAPITRAKKMICVISCISLITMAS